jgi:methionyl-tRNA synthetase
VKDTFFITTAIDYTNAAPHIGHAYEKVLADVIARYRRLRGDPVFFLTGVDQHGQKVQQSAAKAGVSPREFAEVNTAKFQALYNKLGIAFDGWAATTDPRHVRVVQAVLQSLYDRGQIYKTVYKGFYSVRQEQFLTEKERGPDGAYGPEWGEVVELEEENYYFRLSEHREWLIDLLRRRPELVSPQFRAADALNAAEKLSGDLSISRPKARLDWGIELPFDKDFVTYVWFDALINYISFAGYLNDPASGANLPEFARLWPANAHVIGKDILVPAHGIYWPIMLHAMGFPDEAMPRLLVHGWWNSRGEKMSKTVGNVVDPDALADRYGVGVLRYYLMRDIVTGQDADFSEQRLAQVYDSELAKGVGNLLNRSLNMAQSYRGGVLSAQSATADAMPEIAAVRARALESLLAYARAMDDDQPRAALDAVVALVNAGNGLVDATAPFKLAKLKEDAAAQSRLDAVLYALAETSRILALMLAPVLPEASAQMLSQIGWSLNPGEGDFLIRANWGSLPEGHTLGKPSPVFPRLELATPTS